MVQVIWSLPALADLREIFDYIARDSSRYAEITVKKIRGKAGILSQFPDVGHFLVDAPNTPYRQLMSGAYRIIYRHETETQRVYVVAVIHGARLLPPILDERGL